jgi:hypothetical protein
MPVRGVGAAADAPALSRLRGCEARSGVAIVSSPREPEAGGAVRVLVVAERPLDAALVVYAPDGTTAALVAAPRGASPFWWRADVAAAVAGTYRVGLGRGDEVAACGEVHVPARERGRRASAGAWPIERGWDRGVESLYAAWVENLFADPIDAQPSWHGLGEILGDPVRNVLHDHLGLGEDATGAAGLQLEPDCADLPFFLRAYFAWKLGLPFGYSECSRGGRAGPPRCRRWHSNLERAAAGGGALAVVKQFLRRDLAWTIHSGSARTPADDDRGDLYPTRLAPETIRPGTVYADPYGHTLVVVGRVPQTADAGGILFAVDAQPDGTVARKRFWRGTFLFAVDPSLGSAGFKHFRPIAGGAAGLRPLDNDAIARDPAYGDFSLEQYAGGVDGFYDRMDDLLSPTPMDPGRVLRETVQALDEQVRTRVQSVATGEEYLARTPSVIAMPEGAAIFETEGAWEDYATPARDLRLLIAIDVATGFADRVARRPQRYAMPAGRSTADVRAELAALLRDELANRRFTYQRSDGNAWTLSLADVVARRAALEMAYNPNDCVETRWGAPADDAEAATCRRHAPREQLVRMEQYRVWFAERRRPVRD